ncbi:Stress-induced-phosphoprotein 1 [Seminavis robusta]|uniref:Stress-induced-phosphoprotein 1 n=1 Tax=Seminavis robusta TaxID=568900 RepID=A0A9N8HMF6_9STRA|nr:Stress-induced-phosphoprotein 1 [Seminavis robusta]|eukprot:Sro741_g195770.1 Stress-induced-phosphoprotein 1 (538) ;mRNA; f:36897-38681
MSKSKESRNKGNSAFKAGKWQEAIKYYTRAINLDGKDFLCMANRSAAHLRLGNHDEALRDAERCIKIKASYAKGHVRKAAAFHAMKRYDDEFKAIREGIRFCPHDETLKQGLEQTKAQRTKSSKASQAARRTQATMKAARSRGKKVKKSQTVSQFVMETKKILELQMAAIRAQLDMINELMVMGMEEKLDLLFSLMDKDGGGTIDAKELAEGLRKQNDGLSFSGSIEKSIEMIAIFDEDGDAELDRQEFESFVSKMVEELSTTFDEFAEFLVYQILFSDNKEEEEEIDIHQVNQLVKERGELLDSLNDPRMRTLYELFDRDGDGTVSFKEVACGLYHLTNNMEESAKATTGLLLMLDKDDQRMLGFQQFAKLILAIAASTGITFDEVADDLTLALSSGSIKMSRDVLRELTLADEEYTKVRNKERKQKSVANIDPLSYNRCLKLFDLWDADGDGTLDFDELYQGLCKYHNAARDGKDTREVRRAARKLMAQDQDGDQLLDPDEFACAMISYADSMGTDVHGLIDFMCVATALGDQMG